MVKVLAEAVGWAPGSRFLLPPKKMEVLRTFSLAVETIPLALRDGKHMLELRMVIGDKLVFDGRETLKLTAGGTAALSTGPEETVR